MKRLLFALLILLTVGTCFAQKKAKAPTDTCITVAAYIANIQAQIKQANAQAKAQDWYDNFVQYQSYLTYMQGKIDFAKTIKDSTITVPRQEIR